MDTLISRVAARDVGLKKTAFKRERDKKHSGFYHKFITVANR